MMRTYHMGVTSLTPENDADIDAILAVALPIAQGFKPFRKKEVATDQTTDLVLAQKARPRPSSEEITGTSSSSAADETAA